MINKRLIDLQEQLNFNYDLVALELDTSPKRLRYISSAEITDGIEKDAFDAFFNDIKTNNSVVVSFDENTDMYEIDRDSVYVLVLHEYQMIKYVIFDIQDSRKIENLIFKTDKHYNY